VEIGMLQLRTLSSRRPRIPPPPATVWHAAFVLGAVVQPDLFYARQQMALSLGWHIVIACLGIGMPVLVVIAEWRALRSDDPLDWLIARRWSKALAVLFAVGAVSGTILSFEFGILWPRWMGEYGDVMGLPFAIEGFAFFVEAIFVGLYLYGWDRLPKRVHFLTGIPIIIAGVASAFFVVAANGWMNEPTGFTLKNGVPTDIHPWSALFNGALWPEATHMIIAALMVSGFLVAAVQAWPFVRGRGTRYHRRAFVIAFTLGAVFAPIQVVVGDWAARHVADTQPVKLAAMEGLAHTEKAAPIHVGGWFNGQDVVGGIRIPDMLSFLAFHNTNATVKGLDTVPAKDQPPVNTVRIAFQLMVGIGTGLLVLGAWFWWRTRRRRTRDVTDGRWFMRAAALAGPGAVLALEAGWVTTEVGRQPWIVYQVMHVSDAVTDAPGIRYGYFALLVVYAALTVGTILALRKVASAPMPAIATAPADEPDAEATA
jgi:cytochrome d ubiquinol oxidase subunit I